MCVDLTTCMYKDKVNDFILMKHYFQFKQKCAQKPQHQQAQFT